MAGKGQITRASSGSMLLIGHGRYREHPNEHFRLKGPARANIAQLPVAHARTQWNTLRGSRDLRSLPVTLVLVLPYYIL